MDKTKKRKIGILGKIGIGFVFGIIAGSIVGPQITVIQPIGDLFIRLLSMLVYPLVFFSLAGGAASIGDIRKLARIGSKTIVLFILTTAIAIAIGILFGNFFQPGVGSNLTMPEVTMQQVTVPSIIDTLLNMIPKNPIAAAANNQILPVIVFAIFFGISASLLGKQGEKIISGLDMISEVMYKMTHIVIQFAPYGVFALIAVVVGKHGISALIPLGKLILVFYSAIICHIVLVQLGLLGWLFARLNPIKIIKGILPAIIFAAVTDSSSATLPVTMRCTKDNLGVSDEIASFVLPLGATVNMDGSALYQGIVCIFLAQILGIDLSISQQLAVLLTAVLASIGTAGVPSASLIMLAMTLTAAGIPLEAIGIVAGVDRILGIARIIPNIIGDVIVACGIAKQEGALDEDIFNQKKTSLEI